MTIKKNQQTTYVTDTHSEGERTVMAKKPNGNTYEMSQKKLISIIITAIVATAVSTSFALVRVANSDHFSILALNERVDTLEEVVVPRTEFSRFDSDITNRLDRIEAKLDRLSER